MTQLRVKHKVLVAADAAYQAALIADHGFGAVDARYRPSIQTAHVQRLGAAYKEALRQFEIERAMVALEREIDAHLPLVSGWGARHD